MKFSIGCSLVFLLPLASILLPSCGNSGPDLSQGLKLTIVTNNKEAIADAAGNPSDSLFTWALNKAFDQPGPTTTNVRNFLQYYKEQKARKPLSDFFYSGNTRGFVSEAALEDFLKTAVATKQKRMEEVVKARLKAFLEIDTAIVRIEHPADNQLFVYVPGISDKAALKPVFGNRDGLHFWETYDVQALILYRIKLNRILEDEARSKLPQEKEMTGNESLQEIVERNNKLTVEAQPLDKVLNLSAGNTIGVSKIEDTAEVNKLLNAPAAKSALPENIRWVWGKAPGRDLSNKTLALYAIKLPYGGKSPVDNDDIALAKGNVLNGKPEISLEMTPMGKLKWSRMTRNNIGKAIIIELNHFIYSAPTVNEEITGGRSSITGDFTEKEMDELVKVLNSGSFPLSFKVTHTDAYRK